MLKLSYSDLKDMFPPRQKNKNIYEHSKPKIMGWTETIRYGETNENDKDGRT